MTMWNTLYVNLCKARSNLKYLSLFLLLLVYLFVCTPHKVIGTVVSHISFSSLHSIYTSLAEPNSGESVLPDIVQEVTAIIRDRKLPDYNLSDKIVGKKWYFQQIIASSWPVQCSDQSKNIFFRIKETPSIPYTSRENYKHVFLCIVD